MSYSEAIRSGFGVINRNWQLVVIQVVVMLINCLLFFIMVMLPIVFAAVAIGIDVKSLSDIQGLSRNIGGYLTQYLGLVMVGVVFFFIYLLIVSIISIYMYGASSGTIAHSIKNPSDSFSLRRFFGEGKRLFWPIFGYLAAVGLMLIFFMIIIAGMFAVVFVLGGYLTQLDSHLGYFARIFLVLLSVSVMLFIVTFGLSVTFYGTAILIFDGKGAFAAIKESVLYLYKKHAAYWFYCILLGASVAAAIVLALMGLPMNDIPVVGVFLTIPYQFFTYVVQSYFGLLIVAMIFVYYVSSGISDDRSIQVNDTYAQGDTGHGAFPGD